jgi:hypothetical protein
MAKRKRKRNGFKIELNKNLYTVYYKAEDSKIVRCTVVEQNYDGSETYNWTGKAQCNFDEGDVFDENYGRELALDRALEKRENYWRKKISLILKNQPIFLTDRSEAIIHKAKKVMK